MFRFYFTLNSQNKTNIASYVPFFKKNRVIYSRDDINVITAEINAYQQVAGEAIFEIGRRLKGVRDNPEKYGFEGFRDWERWCEDELGMSRRYANQFIKVVDRFGESGFPGLPQSITVLNALSTFTDEQLEQEYELPNGEKKKPVDMSRRQIEELKRQLKAERAERERLEQENEELARYSILSACTKHAGGTNVVTST